MVQDNRLPPSLQPLIDLPHWVIWCWEKNKKVPYQAKFPRRKAAADGPHTWATYQEAVDAVAPNKGGVGFTYTPAIDLAGLDLDDCRNAQTGEIASWAQAIVDKAKSYTEVSVSGTGLHIIGTAKGENTNRKLGISAGGSCEIYRKTNHFLYITGKELNGSVAAFADLDGVIDQIIAEVDANNKEARSAADEDPLERLIRDGECGQFGGDRSRAEYYVIHEMFRRGYRIETIAQTLLDHNNKISLKAYGERDPKGYVARQIKRARDGVEFAVDEDGKPYGSQDNIRLALLKLGVTVRYNEFANNILINGLDGFGPLLDDAAMIRLWLTVETRFHFLPSKSKFYDVTMDTARLNGFHPVREYLDLLLWDGVKRIDTWLSVYGGAENNEYTRAVGALSLIAAVRRVRQPGCKFDEMLTLEGEQGTGRSTALAILAVKPEWFCDSLPLDVSGKEVIELISGKWIVETAELSGLRKASIEHIKAMLSRQRDRGRMAYDRVVSEVPRQTAFFGTTNDAKYLKDQTGNRRFWPVQINKWDLEKLKADRDQLWAEASYREAQGESIRLDPQLYSIAAEEQTKRLIEDPYVEALDTALGDRNGKIMSEDVWLILNVQPGNRTQEQGLRMGNSMRALGWRRPNNANIISVGGKNVVGYVRGEEPYKWIRVSRTSSIGCHVYYAEDDVLADIGNLTTIDPRN